MIIHVKVSTLGCGQGLWKETEKSGGLERSCPAARPALQGDWLLGGGPQDMHANEMPQNNVDLRRKTS